MFLRGPSTSLLAPPRYWRRTAYSRGDLSARTGSCSRTVWRTPRCAALTFLLLFILFLVRWIETRQPVYLLQRQSTGASECWRLLSQHCPPRSPFCARYCAPAARNGDRISFSREYRHCWRMHWWRILRFLWLALGRIGRTRAVEHEHQNTCALQCLANPAACPSQVSKDWQLMFSCCWHSSWLPADSRYVVRPAILAPTTTLSN